MEIVSGGAWAQGTEDDATGVTVTSDLIRAAQVDARAFEPIYRAYAPLIHTYCRRRLGAADAADATSQVFVQALRALPGYRLDERRPASFRSWLFSIAHNVVIDRFRRHRSEPSLDQVIEGRRARVVIDPDPLPDIRIEQLEREREIAAAIATLPEPQRSILDLRLLGLRRKEIAGALGLSDAAVRSAQFRAFATLRDQLAEYAPDDMKEDSR